MGTICAKHSMRLLFIADFSEQFPNRILKGIRKYSQESGEPWVVCKMPPSYVQKTGFDGLVAWTRKWQADVVLANFNPGDKVEAFRKYGIAAIAIDNISPFAQIPNLTADYHRMGEMAAAQYVAMGFRNFGFFGYNGVCWSDARRQGFRDYLEGLGLGQNFHVWDRIRTDTLWSYDEAKLGEWLNSLPKPIGIMACDDTQANILLEGCRSSGINVPAEIAVIGVDNDEMLCSMTDPQLSSIDVDLEGGGYAIARMAERMVREPDYPGEDIVLRPIGLVQRLSSSMMATDDKAVQAAIAFINHNADKKIKVADVLQHVPMSRRSLEQHFMKATGLSIHDYITQVKIEYLSQRLLESNDPVSAIVAKMDEADAKSITRRFVSVKGCTPTEFRRKHLRKLGV